MKKSTILMLAWFILFASHITTAEPSFDCQQNNNNVEQIICDSNELSTLDKQMSTEYFRIYSNKKGNDKKRFKEGARRWLTERNQKCNIQGKAGYNCIKKIYLNRLNSLKELNKIGGRTYTFALSNGAQWLTLASRESKKEAISLAQAYASETDNMMKTHVFLSSNGWYAISMGPFNEKEKGTKYQHLKSVITNFDSKSFFSYGNDFLNLVYSAEVNKEYAFKTNSSSAQNLITSIGSNGQTCDRNSLRNRQIMCYVLAVGEYGCSEYLESKSGYNNGHLRGEVSAAVACNIIATKISNGNLDPDMLVTSAVIGAVDSIGEKLMESDNGLSKFLGFATRVTAGGAKLAAGVSCARKEASNCGY